MTLNPVVTDGAVDEAIVASVWLLTMWAGCFFVIAGIHFWYGVELFAIAVALAVIQLNSI